MLNPKLVLGLAAIVAVGATQLVDSNSTIATIASADGDPDNVGNESIGSQPSSSAMQGAADTEQLNFEQPATSSATLSDFYGEGSDDDGFANPAGTPDMEDIPKSRETTSNDEPVPTRQVSPRSPQTPARVRQNTPSPTGIRSNGQPDQPIELGPLPPGGLGF